MKKNIYKATGTALILSAALAMMLTGCGQTQTETATTAAQTQNVAATAEESAETAASETEETTSATSVPNEAGITVNETLTNSEDGGHAIEADGETASYTNIKVEKTGESSGDEADFYGENAAIFATNGAVLDLSDIVVSTDGTHANAVFSYGEGTTVTISDSVITTSGNCSGGIMTTGGGTMNASNLNIHTTGNSSAAIRSDRGGGTVTVNGGEYVTDGTGSPVIYSTADITVNDASLTSTASQGVVVEGKNSVTLNNVDLTADNNTKNSDKSDYYQAVMIYQSMSGDAAEGASSFSMTDGSLTNKNGDIFFVNNTVTTISLSGTDITNEDESGIFLRAAAAGWGNEGSNGGQVTLNAEEQVIEGDIIVDEVSNLNLYLKEASAYTGAINSSGEAGEVYVELAEGSTWTLTGDSYITGLTCDESAVNLNGYTLYVSGEAYTEGSASTGTAIEATVSSSGNSGAPDGMPANGNASGSSSGSGSTPPEKPDGNSAPPDGHGGPSNGSAPPAKPGDNTSSSGENN